MTNISLDTVQSLVNYLTVNGIKRDVILAKIGLTEQKLNQSNQFINACDYELLYQLAEQEIPFRNIGFEFGKTIDPDRWGILGYIAFTAPTLKAALVNQRNYQTLVGNLGTPLQEFHQGSMVLKWLPAYRCSFHTVEEIITGWAVMAKSLSNNTVQPLALYFTHNCHTKEQEYQDFFECEVNFNSDFNGIKIEQSVLDTALTKHNPELHNLLCQHASKMINNLVEELPIEVITRFISNQLPLGVPEIEDAAKNLQMSVRTLQRKLNENQQTFTGLINIIRQDLATSYLGNTNTKIIYISQMLGFSEQSAFQRAFKRWTGKTPKQFRDEC